MHVGLTMFATDRSLAMAEVAREAEERGFYSLYVPEHTHIPTVRATPPPTGDATLAEEYARTLDPFVALTAAAAVTSRLRVGTGVCLLAQRDPIVTAKAVATLDLVSAGRFVLGVGFGWNREEMADHGVDYQRRRDVVREKVLAMRALWTREEAAFDGSHVRFAPTWSWPKPAPGRPPVLVGGGAGPKLFAAIAEYGDGWMPIGGSGLARAVPALRERVAAAGRDPATLSIVPFGTIPDPGKLEHYRALGVTEVMLRLPSAGRDEVLARLDEYTAYLPEG